jgi:hypothetical protein
MCQGYFVVLYTPIDAWDVYNLQTVRDPKEL